MSRPDPALLDPAVYPRIIEIDVRFSDLDLNLHINNVAICDILQEVRVRFHGTERYDGTTERQPMVVARTTVDYLGEARYAEPLTAYVGVTDIGRTSHTLAKLLMQGDTVIAFGTVILVSRDDGKPAPPTEALRQLLEDNRVRL